VKIDVEVPRKLSRREKEALEHFSEVHKASPRNHLQRYLRDQTPRAS
jgi:hypothetical protein